MPSYLWIADNSRNSMWRTCIPVYCDASLHNSRKIFYGYDRGKVCWFYRRIWRFTDWRTMDINWCTARKRWGTLSSPSLTLPSLCIPLKWIWNSLTEYQALAIISSIISSNVVSVLFSERPMLCVRCRQHWRPMALSIHPLNTELFLVNGMECLLLYMAPSKNVWWIYWSVL